jgi:hypothetical protein
MSQKAAFILLLGFASFVSLQMGYSTSASADSMMEGGSMGNGMMHNMPGNGENQSLPEKNSKQGIVYGQYCGQCHAPPSPRLHTAEEWPSVIVRMMQHIAKQGKAKPETEQLTMILDYVKHYAK